MLQKFLPAKWLRSSARWYFQALGSSEVAPAQHFRAQCAPETVPEQLFRAPCGPKQRQSDTGERRMAQKQRPSSIFERLVLRSSACAAFLSAMWPRKSARAAASSAMRFRSNVSAAFSSAVWLGGRFLEFHQVLFSFSEFFSSGNTYRVFFQLLSSSFLVFSVFASSSFPECSRCSPHRVFSNCIEFSRVLSSFPSSNKYRGFSGVIEFSRYLSRYIGFSRAFSVFVSSSFLEFYRVVSSFIE